MRQAVFIAACLPGLLALALYARDYFRRAWSIVTFPFGWDYGESPELQRAITVTHGGPIYTFWNHPPYHMANYTPLFPLFNSLFVYVFGVQYQSGRAIALVCSLLFCAGLAWLAWRDGRTMLAPIVTTLLWFSSYYVWSWTPLNREDELAMLFSLAGLLVVYEGIARPASAAAPQSTACKQRWRAVWLALPCFLAAIYTRQTTVEAMIAVSGYLLFRRPGLAWRFILLFAVLAGGIFALLDIATRGAFALNIITGNQNVFRLSLAIYEWRVFWTHYQGAAVLALTYALLQMIRCRHMLFTLWLLATFAIAVTIGKDGASSNYGLLPWAAVSLTAGLAVAEAYHLAAARWLDRRRLLQWVGAVVPAFVIGFVLLLNADLSFHIPYTGPWSSRSLAEAKGADALLRGWSNAGWYRAILPMEPPPDQIQRGAGALYKPSAGPANVAEQAQLDALVAAAPGDVLDEDMTHLLLAGKRIYIQPFEFTEEALLGRWNPQPVVRAIAERRFGLIILTKPVDQVIHTERFTPAMVAAIAAHYCLSLRTANYFVYRPCPS